MPALVVAMAPASPITEYKLALIRDWTEPAASRADVRASSIVALSAVALLRKAARQNSAIAQNRLAHVLATGAGAPVDKVEALKWHTVAKTAGKGDPELDDILADMPPEDRAKGEAAARKWIGNNVK